MATDVDVQYFSHLNGLTLNNNWGDLIRLLDKALVTGVDFTQITAASIDAQGDVHITLYAAHNAMLFQVVELTGFAPASFNQKYRIKGVPNTTQLILKPHTVIVETSITTVGAGKLAPFGYEIIFRDANDVKRVYRAKNPTAQHPFIRVDESLTSLDGTTGVYTSTYAKFAMVGLLEHMEHIDDYANPDVLQLPFEPTNPAKNWKITGTGTSVVRGWSRWYFARAGREIFDTSADSSAPSVGTRSFTICGDKDALYFLASSGTGANYKTLKGCGIFSSALPNSLVPNWFLMSTLKSDSAGTSYQENRAFGATPLTDLGQTAYTSYLFHVPTFDEVSPLGAHTRTNPILPDSLTGSSALYNGTEIAALEVPFSDTQKKLRGTLKHVMYSGINLSALVKTTPVISGSSMYINDSLAVIASNDVKTGGLTFYLGELE
ncbi:hypothetical protein [Acinetobacter indicus]|uniref:hypothetical protein n=1 Tax=Acinetobacter indicus TaxID=756892 RepID=UPI0034CF56BF